jgi:aspartate racemase
VIVPPAGTLGVLGGMGPAATADFLRLLAVESPARTDQEHPRVVLLSEPAVPERTQAILAESDAPARWLHEGLEQLVAWGADLLAMPCNTAHAFLDGLPSLPVPIVHIVDATVRRAVCEHPYGVWLLASTGTVASRMYQRAAGAAGLPLHVPSPRVQADIHECVALVKANRQVESLPRLRAVVAALHRERALPLMAACTELPMALGAAGVPGGSVVSSLQALAAECLRRLYEAAEPAGIRGTA